MPRSRGGDLADKVEAPGDERRDDAFRNVARAAETPIGLLTVDGNMQPFIDQGASFVAVGTDMHLLIGAADAW